MHFVLFFGLSIGVAGNIFAQTAPEIDSVVSSDLLRAPSLDALESPPKTENWLTSFQRQKTYPPQDALRSHEKTGEARLGLVEHPLPEQASDSQSLQPQVGHGDSLPKFRSDVVLKGLEPISDDYRRNSLVFSDKGSAPQPRVGIRDVLPLFSGDASLEGLEPISDECRRQNLVMFVDYDSFMGTPDGGWSNNGIRTGLDFSTSLGSFSDLTGIGLQAGGSVGVYDWSGTDYRVRNRAGAEVQGFFTYGLFRKPTDDSRITAGLVQDWSVNDTYGVFGQNPIMSQLRGQLGYAFSASNEFGIAATAHVLESHINIPPVENKIYGPTTFRPINQLSAYWHHKWYAGGPDTWVSAGAPTTGRLAGDGGLGSYLVAASSSVPLSDAVSVFSNVTYMHPAAGLGKQAPYYEPWNFTVGICIYPQRNSRSTTVAGQRWMSLLPVANNGTFLVDTNRPSKR